MPRSRRPRPPRTATTTVALAAALAGELVVGTLTFAPTARAESADPTVDATTEPARDAPSEPDPAPEPPPEPAPEAPAADVPAAAPAPAPAPEVPATPDIPVRTGYTADPGSGAGSGAAPAPADPGTRVTPAPEVTTGAEPAPGRDAESSPNRSGHEASGVPARDGHTPAGRRTGVGTQAADHRRAARTRATRGLPAGPPAPASAAPLVHTVIAGEHLWGIAAGRLAASTGREASSLTAVEIAPYWTRLCMSNAARLRSGDLDLVYPGEVLELPPI